MGKIIVLLMIICFVASGYAMSQPVTNKAQYETGNLEELYSIASINAQYSFADDYSYIGSYELVKQYELAGGEWFSQTKDIYDYSWSQCLNVWNSYINLYVASGDEKWLYKLSQQINEIFSKRDSILGKLDRNGFSLPSWSYTSNSELYGKYHNPVMLGLIIYPILRFVEEVRLNHIEKLQECASQYLENALQALSVIDSDINKHYDYLIPEKACENLWRERTESNIEFGYYVGHLYYEEDYFKNKGYVSNNPLPYNQSLSVAQCFPVLYRILGDSIWKEKTIKSWNWLKKGISKNDDDVWWWYYSENYNWCRTNAVPISSVPPPEDFQNYYEDYEGHYSIDLLFIIEAFKIGVIDNVTLEEINRNKKEMGLSNKGWPFIMNCEAQNRNNLKAAVYFDYFAIQLNDLDYKNMIYPVLLEELKVQYDNNTLAAAATKINGTCLRLLVSAFSFECYIDQTKPSFKYHALVLDGQIGLRFYMHLPGIEGVNYSDGKTCHMDFDINGDTTSNIPREFYGDYS